MISWFTRNDVAANLLMLSIILSGLYSLFNLIPLEFFPTIESNRITVKVSLRGATPEDAELSLATRIEEAIKDLEGIEEYSSRSAEGGTTVVIKVEQGYDARNLLDEVKNRVDAINTFPSDAEQPNIALAQRLREAISVTISGDVTEKEIRLLGEQVREEILQLPGVTQAKLDGVRNYEISIELKQDRLREFDLSLQQVANAISQSSLDLSAGNVNSASGEILIRSKGQAYFQNEFEEIPIKTNIDGSILRLRDLARVSDGFEEDAINTQFNGRPAVTVDVFRVGDQSATDVSSQVRGYVDRKKINLGENLEINYWSDRSEIINKRVNTLVRNAIQGGILVILLLSLFLRPAVAFWVFLGIPVSFLGAFLSMAVMGVTLNMISLFAFIVVLGIVVDDAIVTGENVYRHLQTSENSLHAAINGTKEVAVPVTFGVLTTVVAFVPLGFMEGNRGPIFAQIPLIVVPVLLFSLIESKFVLPAHLKHLQIRKGAVKPNRLQMWQRQFSSGFERAILKYYQPALIFCLQRKRMTLVFFVGLFSIIITSIFVGHFKFTFFPRIPSETVRFNLVMPTGTPFEITDRHMQRVLESAKILQKKYYDEKLEDSLISNILTITGDAGGRSHRGKARFTIASPETRSLKISSRELVREWRRMIGVIPGAEQLTFRAEIGRTSDPVDVQLRAERLDQLEIVADKVKTQLASYRGVFDIGDNFADGKQELRIDLKPEAHLLNLSRSDIVRQVRQGFFGLQAQRIQRGRDDVRVMVRFPKNERDSISYLNNMLINTASGQRIPLSQIATLTPGLSPTTIYRIDGYRTINVIADIEKEIVNMTALGDDLQVFLDTLLVQYPGVTYRLGGEQEEQAKTFSSLAYALVAVIFLIYVLLAVPFKSYLQPLVVMSVIPFGLIGAMLGHWLMGMNLTIMSAMGLLALIGVLVNDSLVLVDYINKTRQKTGDLLDAVVTAGAARFRPVMLTSLTTFLGLMPLLFEKETQAQFLIPMAISLGFGIIFATFITLILVPVNYIILEHVTHFVRGLWRAPAEKSSHY